MRRSSSREPRRSRSLPERSGTISTISTAVRTLAAMASDRPVDLAAGLLQTLIRNRCVNDWTPTSGHEARNVDALVAVLEGSGIDLERYEPLPGRANLVARIEGRNPSLPTLLLLANTDVVSADPYQWSHDPFCGDLIDDEVWGRGALSNLGYAATMAVAMRCLADRGYRPEGTLVFVAAADHEFRSEIGSRWLIEHHLDAVRAEWVVTGGGGLHVPGPDRTMLTVQVGEKSSHWFCLVVRGEPVHTVHPDAPGVVGTAAEVVTRLSAIDPDPRPEYFREGMERAGWAAIFGDLDNPRVLQDAATALGPDLARWIRVTTYPTVLATGIRGGGQGPHTPDRVEVDVNVRLLPGQPDHDAEALLHGALGDLADHVEIHARVRTPATVSPTDTKLWGALEHVTERARMHMGLLPVVFSRPSDLHLFRALGATAYGAGMLSERFEVGDVNAMFHGHDERLDVASIDLLVTRWQELAVELLGGS